MYCRCGILHVMEASAREIAFVGMLVLVQVEQFPRTVVLHCSVLEIIVSRARTAEAGSWYVVLGFVRMSSRTGCVGCRTLR